MSSLITNVSAMTALRTLQQTNQSLESVQSRISTGYRVAEAKDNAAYWSIATGMRSDNLAMSAVKDSLGIGAATVDTAYTGMKSVKDALDEIKAKLTTASQDGIDKSKVQSEISQLQQQIKTISESASFSGANWLSVTDMGSRSIVASFSRTGQGGLALGSIDVPMTKTALFTTDTGTYGLLEGTKAEIQSAPFTGLTGADAGTTLTFSVTLDSVAKTYSVTVTDPTKFGIDELVSGLGVAVGTDGLSVSKVANQLVFTSNTRGPTSGVEITAVGGLRADGTTALAAADLGGLGVVAPAAGSDKGILDIDITTASGADIQRLINTVDTWGRDVTAAASDLGSIQNRVNLQTTFVSNLMDAIDRGVGTLVDADMSEESTKLKALQTQQQLGVQSLSIANTSAQSILQLFQG